MNNGGWIDEDAGLQRPTSVAGVDVSRLEELLALTPAQRVARHEQALALVRALRQAGIDYYGFDPRPPQAVDGPRR